VIRIFQQRITAAIMPPAAFVAVPRLPHPPFESQLLLSVGPTELMTRHALQSALNCSNSANEDTENLLDYLHQTVSSSTVLLQHHNTEHNTQLM